MPQKESLDLINTCEDIRRCYRPKTAVLPSVKRKYRHYFDETFEARHDLQARSFI